MQQELGARGGFESGDLPHAAAPSPILGTRNSGSGRGGVAGGMRYGGGYDGGLSEETHASNEHVSCWGLARSLVLGQEYELAQRSLLYQVFFETIDMLCFLNKSTNVLGCIAFSMVHIEAELSSSPSLLSICRHTLRCYVRNIRDRPSPWCMPPGVYCAPITDKVGLIRALWLQEKESRLASDAKVRGSTSKRETLQS